MNIAAPLAERFHAKVGPQLANGCKEWQGYCWPNGYGAITTKKPGRALAHRVAYALTYGEIPQGKVVMHTCDNPRCVNVSPDMKAKGRGKRSKLFQHFQDIAEMRKTGYTHQYIADRYGVSRSLITLLFTGRLLTFRSL